MIIICDALNATKTVIPTIIGRCIISSFQITMGKVPKKPVRVSKPGSYNVKVVKVTKAKAFKQLSTSSKNSVTSSSSKVSKKGKGRPSSAKKAVRHGNKFRDSYTEEDLQEAIRLVKEEDLSVAAAAIVLNDVKKNKVLRIMLSDCLKKDAPSVKPRLGQPQVHSGIGMVLLTAAHRYLPLCLFTGKRGGGVGRGRAKTYVEQEAL
jgi:hypothetical protein